MSKRVSNEKYKDRIEKKYPGKYTFLSKYVDSKTKVHIRHNKCGHDDWVMPRYLTSGTGCGICRPSKPLTTEYIRNYISENYDGYELLSEYTNRRCQLRVKHSCGCEFDIMAETILDKNSCYCPQCYNKNHNCITGINDICTTDRWMFDLLLDKDFGYTHKTGSHKKTWFICPSCGNKVYQKPYYVNLYGVNCSNCKTSISYPERFAGNMFTQLGVNTIFQFSPKWAGDYRYDFLVLVDDKFILELDGGFHYINNNLSGKSVYEQKNDDKVKQELAEKHGYKVIRIDCDYGGHDRFSYIKEHILNSDLSNLFDLSIVDFGLCNEKAIMPLVQVVADAWNTGEKTISDLCIELNLSDTTIRNRLYDAFNNGLIKDSPDEIKRINRQSGIKKYGHKHSCYVICNETGEVFFSYKEADQKYHASLSNYFREENRKFSGALPDGTRLTWTKL